MELSPKAISEEYKKSVNFKESLGEKGMFEQNEKELTGAFNALETGSSPFDN